MRVEKEIDERLNARHDLIQIMDAAAEYLASRDTDAQSQARARWKLWAGPNGETWIGLQLDDQGYSKVQNFTPSQLVPPDIRRLRLASLWTDVAFERAWRENRRVNELISRYEGE